MVFSVAEFQLPPIHGATLAHWYLPIKNWLDSGSCGTEEIESKTQKREINRDRSTLVLLSALFTPICNMFHQAGLTIDHWARAMFHSASLLLKDGRTEINIGECKAKAVTRKKGGQESLAWCVKQKWMKKKFSLPKQKAIEFWTSNFLLLTVYTAF